jgi:hypothetical protein
MFLVATACAVLLIAATLIHYEALRLLSVALPGLRVPSRMKLVAVIVGTFFAHVVEIAVYGLAIYSLSRWFGAGLLGPSPMPSLDTALYFSAETFTSLGYGDVVPQGPLRMLAGMEALNGLLLIGWSASYIYVSMERFWNGGRA